MNVNTYKIIDNKSHKSLSIKQKLYSILKKNNWVEDNYNYQFIFVIGGDGTFLKNIDQYANKKIIAINGGNLGYFSCFNLNNLDKIVKYVGKKNAFRKILTLNILINDQKYTGLNELYLYSNHTLNVDVFISKEKLQTFKGTGIMISTPMGSTAHSKNAGGAIIFQNENLLQLLEIHPITQKKYSTLKSPLIMNYNHEIVIKNNSKCNENIVIDGKKIDVDFIDKLSVVASFSDFEVCTPNEIKPFIKKLRDSFVREK